MTGGGTFRTVAHVIELQHVCKRYRSAVAVDDLTVTVRPGVVTGFLGPNGSGKSTTMRMILGLDAPTSGVVTVLGRPYRALRQPLHRVGAMVDADAAHPGRSGRHHLTALAASNAIAAGRISTVLELVGLAEAADRRVGEFSLGMRQRLGIAAALLGDPDVVVLDEPVNGLDTDGIRWIRGLLRGLAADGRTVLLSSHLMSEIEVSADHVVVIGRGRLLADLPIADLLATHGRQHTRVRTPDARRLLALLEARRATVEADAGSLVIHGPSPAEIGDLALAHGIRIHELAGRQESLEDVYTRLVDDAVEYRRVAA